jgi:ABC-type Co2+ transport system permease subunit
VRLLKAFAFGSVAGVVVAYATAVTVGLAVAAADAELHIAIGPATLLAVESGRDGFATTFGPGLLVLAIVAGLLNAVVAAALSRRLR